MVIESLGRNGGNYPHISANDRGAINDLLQQLNPKAVERCAGNLASRLEHINPNGGVAVIRDNAGKIVAMGTWTVVTTLMRIEALARDVVVDQEHPEWQRFLKELLQYLIGRAKRANADRIDLTWNETRPGQEVFRELGFTEPDTRLLRLLF